MAMTLKDTLAQLESLGNEKLRAQNRKNGAGDNQFGVRLGDIRKLAAQIKTSHQLAIALWDTGNIDAQLLAILLIEPNNLSRDETDRMVRSANFIQVADWLNSYVVRNHPDKEALSDRCGWKMICQRFGPNRVRNGERCSGNAMDDEFLSCRNRYSLLQASQARHRYRREIGLSRLSGLQGLHLSVRPDLDQRNGASTKLKNRTISHD